MFFFARILNETVYESKKMGENLDIEHFNNILQQKGGTNFGPGDCSRIARQLDDKSTTVSYYFPDRRSFFNDYSNFINTLKKWFSSF